MAFMSVQVGFLFVVVFLLQSEGPLESNLDSEILIFASIAAGAFSILIGRFLKGKLMVQARNAGSIEAKKSRYMTSFLILIAIPEFAVIFSTIAYWMSGDKFVLGIILVLLILEGSQKPGPNKFKIDLGISEMEYQEMDNPDS